MALSNDTLAVLNQYQQSGDYVHYYQTLLDAGERYGSMDYGMRLNVLASGIANNEI